MTVPQPLAEKLYDDILVRTMVKLRTLADRDGVFFTRAEEAIARVGAGAAIGATVDVLREQGVIK